VNSRQEWREWLLKNYTTEKFCWVKSKRGMWGTGKKDGDGICYLDLVEEALTVGWVDSTSKQGYQRFSPRRKNSNWTQLNIARCERLERLGLMTDSGRAVMPKTAFKITQHIIDAIKTCQITWENYQSLPDIYKRVRIDNIQSYYGYDNKVYTKRLQKFLDNTRQGKLYGDWHDGGRLL